MILNKKIMDEIKDGAKQIKEETNDLNDALSYVEELVHDINEDMNLNFEEGSSEYEELQGICLKVLKDQFN